MIINSCSRIGRYFALLGSMLAAILNFSLIISVGNTYKVWELLKAENMQTAYHSLSQLIILYPLIGQYFIIGLCFICLTAIIKDGFTNVKKYEDCGLIESLIFGLIVGLMVGFIFGLILGIFSGLIAGLIFGFIFGLVYGMISGLIDGFTFEFD